ncbi:hypothetical protein B5S31_g5199 [[Candida] boidinii]|nr:hypothetical protein B5S29_g2039 [[Candida] boidinii]OWB75316.1 hypothetical protein B5S31_g5199 [[Candida] boidinii]
MSSENSEDANATVLPPISSISNSLPLTSTVINNQRILSANTLQSPIPTKQITSTNSSQSPELQSSSTSVRNPLPSYSSSLSKLLNNDVHESDRFLHQPHTERPPQAAPQVQQQTQQQTQQTQQTQQAHQTQQQQQQQQALPVEEKPKTELKSVSNTPQFSNSVHHLVSDQKDVKTPETSISNGDKNLIFQFQQEHGQRLSSEDSHPSPKSSSENSIAPANNEQIRQLTARNRQQMDVKFLSPSTIQSRNYPQNTTNTEPATSEVSDNNKLPDSNNTGSSSQVEEGGVGGGENNNNEPGFRQYACTRCRKLKKKCTKEYPRCSNCGRFNQNCFYPERKNKKKTNMEFVSSRESSVSDAQKDSQLNNRDGFDNNFKRPNDDFDNYNNNSFNNEGNGDIPKSKRKSLNSKNTFVFRPIIMPKEGESSKNLFSSHHRNLKRNIETIVTFIPPPPSVPIVNPAKENSKPPQQPVQETTKETTQNKKEKDSIPNGTKDQQQNGRKGSETQWIMKNNKDTLANMNLEPYLNELEKENSIKANLFENDNISIDDISTGINLDKLDSFTRSNYILLYLFLGLNIDDINQKPSAKNNASFSPQIFSNNYFHDCIYSYFENYQIMYPFVEFNEFQKRISKVDFVKFLDSKNLLPTFENFETLVILCIGSDLLNDKNPNGKYNEYYDALEVFFVKKFKSTALRMIDLKDSSTRLIRILLLLTIHSSNKSNYSKTYQVLGFLTRQCLSIGLNKFQEPGSMRYTKLSKYDLEMRHRLFWSVYNIDRSISITIGCPVSIDDDDINVPLPKYLDNDEPHLVDLIRNTIEINRIRGSLLKEIYSLRAKDRYIKNFEKLSIINTIRNDIENWYINSNNFLMSSFREKEDKMRDNAGNRSSVSRQNSVSSSKECSPAELNSIPSSNSSSFSSVTMNAVYDRTVRAGDREREEETENEVDKEDLDDDSSDDKKLSNLDQNGQISYILPESQVIKPILKPSLSPSSILLNNHSIFISSSWFNLHYYNLLTLLYKPSNLFPRINSSNLDFLLKICFQNISFLYNFHISKNMIVSWLNLFYIITLLEDLLFCVCSLNLFQFDDMINLNAKLAMGIEMIKRFSPVFSYVNSLTSVLTDLNQIILQLNIEKTTLKLNLSRESIPSKESLTQQKKTLKEVSLSMLYLFQKFHKILMKNNIDIWYNSITYKNTDEILKLIESYYA